ncbi:serine/threonine protein kinase, partial [bacterium]
MPPPTAPRRTTARTRRRPTSRRPIPVRPAGPRFVRPPRNPARPRRPRARIAARRRPPAPSSPCARARCSSGCPSRRSGRCSRPASAPSSGSSKRPRCRFRSCTSRSERLFGARAIAPLHDERALSGSAFRFLLGSARTQSIPSRVRAFAVCERDESKRARTMTQSVKSPKSADPMIGRVVAGRYRLETRAGEGGMGVVYRARHVLIDRVVALKLIRPDLRGETHLRAWMLREARAANRVDHAHIIDIHDIGETEEGELYLVMEYLVGTALSSELAKGPLPLGRGVDILEQMCAALARAHDLGVIHRDLKSDNILLTSKGGRKDFVKILDFGLAHLAMDPRL